MDTCEVNGFIYYLFIFKCSMFTQDILLNYIKDTFHSLPIPFNPSTNEHSITKSSDLIFNVVTYI